MHCSLVPCGFRIIHFRTSSMYPFMSGPRFTPIDVKSFPYHHHSSLSATLRIDGIFHISISSFSFTISKKRS